MLYGVCAARTESIVAHRTVVFYCAALCYTMLLCLNIRTFTTLCYTTLCLNMVSHSVQHFVLDTIFTILCYNYIYLLTLTLQLLQHYYVCTCTRCAPWTPDYSTSPRGYCVSIAFAGVPLSCIVHTIAIRTAAHQPSTLSQRRCWRPLCHSCPKAPWARAAKAYGE